MLLLHTLHTQTSNIKSNAPMSPPTIPRTTLIGENDDPNPNPNPNSSGTPANAETRPVAAAAAKAAADSDNVLEEWVDGEPVEVHHGR